MGTIITRIREQVVQKNVDTSSAFGRSWLLQKMAKLNPTAKDRMEIIKDREQQRTRTMIGRFYFFMYSAKTKEDLPYWDRFPLVIPLQRYPDGFLGLNLHYIYPRDRMILLTQLRRFATGSPNDEHTRLKMSYPILSAMSQLYRATPCVKRYLAGHVMSRYIEIPPEEWDIAATLPVQDFRAQLQKTQRAAMNEDSQTRKARGSSVHKEQVWKDSKEKY